MDDVDRWFSTYPVDGIFIDQVSRDLAPRAAWLVEQVRNSRSDAIVVLNPGGIPSLQFMEATAPAIVVIQEQAFANYGETWPPDDGPTDPRRWVRARAMGDVSLGSRRIAIIAHTLPNPSDVDVLIAKAAQYEIGWIHAQHTTDSVYDPFSIHLPLIAEHLDRCSRLGCTIPFGRLFCRLANYILCYILQMNKRLRTAAGRLLRR